MSRKGEHKQSGLCCSFCHKAERVVGKLISSPSDFPRAYICDECIAVCNSIIEDDRLAATPEEVFPVRLNLTYMNAVLQMTRAELEELRDHLTKLLASPLQESPPLPAPNKTKSTALE